MEPSKQATGRQQAREEAAQWVVRLSASPGAAEREAFEVWRNASLDHEIAYARAANAWARLDRLSVLRDPASSPGAAVAALHDREPMDEGEAGAIAAPPRAQGWRQWMALAASLLLIVGAGSIVALFLGVAPAPAYATGLGERRLVMLADGTRVELNSNSSITVHYASGRRSIDLERGEALFRVARDARPFDVRAGQIELQAVRPVEGAAQGADQGAGQSVEVGVRLLNQGARITVLGGRIEARDFAQGAQGAFHQLSTGACATMVADAFNLAMLSGEDIRRAMAWRQGAIALNGETLAEAADEFNRYNHRQIHVVDPRVGAIRVGGYFDTADLDGFLRAVTGTFALHAASAPSGDVTIEAGSAQ